MKKCFTFVLLFLFSASLLPAFAQDAGEPSANLREDCVSEFDPEVDYFPDKAEFSYAKNLSVEYFNHYKVVTVTDAFTGAEPFEYVLVQCGTPSPPTEDFSETAQFIDVPADDIIAMSTTQLPHLKDLGLLDKLIGLDSFLYVNTPEVLERIEAGELTEVGFGANVNVELILNAEPDLVMSYGFDPSSDAFPLLIDAGIFTAINAEWRESSPLGRAEWNKYLALFYNAEAEAEEDFSTIVRAYDEARDLAASVPENERPEVLVNTISIYSDAWVIPGAQTFVGILVQDAGGKIALGDEAPDQSAPLSFESVYESALSADIWLVELFGLYSLDDLLAQDARFADFTAVQNGRVWNSNLDENANGGNNYYELGVTNPHLILQDLVAIFHPDLLPDHEFRFYQRLK